LIDRDIHLARALLVDGNPLLRSTTATELGDDGLCNVLKSCKLK
jgi:hypothetical protein